MVCFSRLMGVMRRFIADERGNAGLEFVTSIPLLLGVLVFTAEYGEALRERMVLDNATHDVARFLARSPIDNAAAPAQPGQPDPDVVPVFYPQTLVEAQNMFDNRVGFGEGQARFTGGENVVFNAALITSDRANFRNDYFVIQMRATTYVDLPLLSLINRFSEDPNDGNDFVEGESFSGPRPLRLFLTSETQVRWLGGAEPGSADCSLQERYQGTCP